MFSEELDSQLVCLRNGLSTLVLRPNKMQTWIEHGRTKRTNVLRPKKISTYVEHGHTKRTNVLRPNKISTYMRTWLY